MRENTIARLSAEGSVSERVRAALERARHLGGRAGLNCVAEVDPTALEQARGLEVRGDSALPLYGVPVLVKDNVDVRGLHTTAGSLALEDNIAVSDAPIVRNLRQSGAVILGKANMTEFANYTTEGMPAGYSSRGGQVVHAINPALSPSGSSSGSAVAVCAGIVPVAVGTDTSFSLIACAQANGICALKPPAGTLSAEGIIPIARTLDSAGPMANCFADALKVYAAMRARPLPDIAPAKLPGLRVAVNTAGRGQVSSAQLNFLRDALDELRRAGAAIDEIEQPFSPHLRVIMKWEFRAQLEDYLSTASASRKTLRQIVEYYEANPERMLRYGDALLRAALYETPGGLEGRPYREAMQCRAELIPKVRAELREYDAVIMTGPTNIMHFCGLPSATISGARRADDGVPRGLILYGGDELRLYSAALALENVLERI